MMVTVIMMMIMMMMMMNPCSSSCTFVQSQSTAVRCYAPDPAGRYSGELTALPQTSWLDFGDRKGSGNGGERERGERRG